MLITLVGSVAGSILLVSVLTVVETRGSLRQRALANLRQTLNLQKAAYNTYLENLRESTLVAASDDNIEQEIGPLINAFSQLSVAVNKGELSARLQRNVLLPSRSTGLVPFHGVDAASLLPQSNQGLALQQLYILNANRPASELLAWSGPGQSAYDRYYENIHESLQVMLHAGGFHDIFIVSKNGDIVFSMAKEFDLGTNLFDGPYADSGLGQLAQALRRTAPESIDEEMSTQQQEKFVRITDVAPYFPSKGAPTLFSGTPVYRNGVLQGYLCVQVDFSAFLNTLSNHRNWQSIGLGNTGDLLLIDRKSTRISESRRLIVSRDQAISQLSRNKNISESDLSALRQAKSSAGILKEQGIAVAEVLNGKSGEGIRENIFGDSTLAAWTPVSAPSGRHDDGNWGLIASQYESEVYAPLNHLLFNLFLNAIFTLTVATALGLWLSQRLVRPLVAVQHLIRQLTGLDLRCPEARDIPSQLMQVANQNGTEVGVLAGDLARLQQQLFSSLDSLETTNATVESLSTPISSVGDGVLLLPLIGQIDSSRADRVRHAALDQIANTRARFFIWDLTGLVDVEAGVAPFLSSLCQAAQLLGCRSILSGVSASLAARLSGDGLVLTHGTLSTASLRDALALIKQHD